ncbi:MAG: hypothetical protein ACOYB8_02480 [Eubacteriaceae bacterium]|jgi:hypothetical protein
MKDKQDQSITEKGIKSRLTALLILNLAVVIMEIRAAWLAFLQQGFYVFLFYTNLSNFLALFASLVTVIYAILCLRQQRNCIPDWVGMLDYMTVCGLTITFLVVVTVLAPMNGVEGYVNMMLRGPMFYHHLLCPVILFFSYILLGPESSLPAEKARLIAMIPTTLYAVVMILLNILKVTDGPYPFLRVWNQPFYASVLWTAAILGGSLLIAWVIQKLNLRFNRPFRPTAC